MSSKPVSRDEPPSSAQQKSAEPTLQELLRAGLWEEADRALEAALPEERICALAQAAYGLAGLNPANRAEGFEDRIAQAGTIEEALLSPEPPGDCVYRLWEQVTQPGHDIAVESCAASAALALIRQLPLSATTSDQLHEIPHPAARSVFGLAIGRCAREGHATAQSLLRQAIGSDDTDDWLRLAIIRGLGDGLLADGLEWLTNRIQDALDDAAAWVSASEHVSDWAAGNPSEHTRELLHTLLAHAQTEGEARQRVVRWCHYAQGAGHDETSLIREFSTRWNLLPATARAALLRHASESGLTLEHTGLDELCGAALVAGLESALATEKPLDPQLLKRLTTHNNTTIRLMAFERLAPAKSLGVVTDSRASECTAEVVALPSSRIARTALDQIRIMLATGEGEEIPAIAARLTREQAEAVIPDLTAALDVPDMGIRRAVIESLGTIGTETEVPVLLEAARRLRGLAGMVVGSIREIGGLDDPDEIAALFDRRLRWADDEAVDDLVALAGDRAAKFLGTVLNTRFYPPVRIGAARAMARHGMRETIFALRIRALTDPQAEVRGEALDALQKLTGSVPSAEEIAGYGPLTASIDVLDEATERAAAAGVAALPGLRATLTKGTWRRRMAACKALGELRCPESQDALHDALTDVDEDVRLTALHSLRGRGWEPSNNVEHTLTAMAERRVDQLVKHGDRLDIPTLAEGLFLGGHVFRTETGAVLSLLARQGQWQPSEEHLAAWAGTRLEPNGLIASEDGLDTLLHLIDRTWQVHPFRALLAHALRLAAVQDLAASIERHAWRWRAREAICRALARPGCPDSPAVLATFVLDSDGDVRSAALAALVKVGTPEAADRISGVVESPFHDDAEAASHALAAVGENALGVMERLAESPWWEARRLTALALREWRGDRNLAVDLALPLAVDPEYRVAEAALEALRRHGRAPSQEALLAIVPRLQALTVYSVMPWLPVDGAGMLTCDKMRALLCEHVDTLKTEELPYFLGVLGVLKVHEAAPILERYVETDAAVHAGVRACATEALRELRDTSCKACDGEGAISCARCQGLGEERCDKCGGRGAIRQPCSAPECSAQAPARAIGSAPCKTCRGRGFVIYPCSCGGGTVRCTLCQGTGNLSCPTCEGTGEVVPTCG